MSASEGSVPPDIGRPAPVPYTLRVGVTGHRAIQDESAVRDAVARLVGEMDRTLRTSAESPRSATATAGGMQDWIDRGLLILVKGFWWSMPMTPKTVPPERRVPLRWRVVSALAKGADQLVAEVIQKDVAGELRAVLPFLPAVYDDDFETPEDRERFRSLLSSTGEPWIASAVDRPTEEQRLQAYRAAGEKVVDESDLLIAVWDGEPARGVGGTAEIVAYAVRNDVPVCWIHANHPDTAPTLIMNDEEGSEQRTEIPTTAKLLALRYHQLCAYFRDSAYRESDYKSIYKRERDFLDGEASTLAFVSETMQAAIQHRLPQHVYADHLALRHQALHLRSTIAIIVFAALAVSAAAIHLLAFPHSYWIIGFEIAFMIGAAVLLRVSLRENWHEKWLYDRYLAERLRSLMFREGLGHPPTEPNSIRDLLPFYEGPANWVDIVLRDESHSHAPAGTSANPADIRRFLNEAWIGSQSKWHLKNKGKKERAHRKFHRASFTLFTLTLLSAVLHWFHVGHENSAIQMHGLPELIAILAVTLPAWGGALHGIAHLMDYSGIAKRSERMHLELGKLAYEMDRAESISTIGDIAKRADELMAMENLEWMMTLAHRKPELHV